MIRDDFDPRTAQDATTSEEAMELARAWADGRRSWWNLMMEMEPRARTGEVAEGARQQTWIAAEEADAAEVAKWAALVPAFLAMEREK